LPGDFDGDRRVSLADMAILQAHFGAAADANQGDINGDGTVTRSDAAIFAGAFGSFVAGSDAATAAPAASSSVVSPTKTGPMESQPPRLTSLRVRRLRPRPAVFDQVIDGWPSKLVADDVSIPLSATRITRRVKGHRR
jgi:hypothetical protein